MPGSPRVLILPIAVAAVLSVAAAKVSPGEGPGSADILGLLPDGEQKSSFILDCTGCHQMDAQRAFAAGRLRTAAEWEASIHRMLQMAGPQSPFPVISSRIDPAQLATWLAEHIEQVPAAAPRTTTGRATLREYAYPYPADLPHDLIVDARGRIVVTGMFTHRMLVLDPETGTYDEVPIPVQNANPRALEIAPDGRWFVLLGAPNRIAVYDPSADAWTTHAIGMYGHSIALDAQGRAWFNGHFTSDPAKVGYVDTGGDVRLYDVPTPEPLRAGAGPIPYELRVAPDGAVWMSELQGNRMIRLDPETGESRAWTMPAAHSGPRRFDIAGDGSVWIPAYGTNRLLRLDPATSRIREFELPMDDAVPYVLRIDPRTGTVWIGASAGDAMFSFDPVTEKFETYPVPTRGALIRHIDIDRRDGTVWAAYGASPGVPARILRVTPAGAK